uniref:Intraflagellar transport protein 88 homolog n=1 Tax=Sus scrofa TaxID=9823 RepID=A0A8D1S5F2_PIG
MMQNVHLAPDTDEDDLYSGYNDHNPTYDTEELENDTAFQQAVRTSHGRRPPITAKVPSTAVARPVATGCGVGLFTRLSCPKDGVTRPMTAVRAAGFTKAALRGSALDPLGQARGPAPPLEARSEDSPEEKIRQLEKKVNELVEESCVASSCGDLKLALEKAKDAGRKERVLVRQREQVASPENINLDLTYSVLFTLASQYSANEMYAEALNTYQVIVKNKMFSNAGRLKVNMGNIYLKQRNYSKAIKFYRMALDQIPSVHKEMRIKIMQNIGVTFIKTGQYSDAVNSFEHIMSTAPNLKAGFNLILSYFALGDREKMKKAFQKLIAVALEIDEDDKYVSPSDDPHTNLVIEAIKNDHLRQMERERKAMAEKYIMTAAKLIAPVIETSFAVGYDWCVEVVKASPYVELANDLEINKAVTYLKQKDFHQVREKMFRWKVVSASCPPRSSPGTGFCVGWTRWGCIGPTAAASEPLGPVWAGCLQGQAHQKRRALGRGRGPQRGARRVTLDTQFVKPAPSGYPAPGSKGQRKPGWLSDTIPSRLSRFFPFPFWGTRQ